MLLDLSEYSFKVGNNTENNLIKEIRNIDNDNDIARHPLQTAIYMILSHPETH